MGRKRPSDVHGVLVVDKPRGPTSHDVVGWARRAFGTRTVGHAGTLDPMASGVLVLAVGEATKLLRWLTSDDKAYVATLSLGAETDTLDAEGEVSERAEVPPFDEARLGAIASEFTGTYLQRAPIFSAIKVDGEALHKKARRGEHVEAPEREVTVRRLELRASAPAELEITVESAKGFYVRALGRDVARALGTRGHLTELRRTRSGAFSLSDALGGDVLERGRQEEQAKAVVRAALLAPAAACRDFVTATLSADALADAHHGRAIAAHTIETLAELADGHEPIAMLDAAGELVAIGKKERGALRVVRGLRVAPAPAAS